MRSAKEVTPMTNSIQTCFKRYEKKYFLTEKQYRSFKEEIVPFVKPDKFGRYTICNIYYDTDDYALIRASLEKPVYKEKLRVRSYGVPENGSQVFIELKKKYDGVVYKRRMTADAYLCEPMLRGIYPSDRQTQISKEISYFQSLYRSSPKAFIAYDREAYAGKDDGELRITFDTNIRYRLDGLDLREGDYGEPLVTDGRILMEIKIPGVCPLFLSNILTRLKIYPTSFSKYGTCYREHILDSSIKAIKKEARLSA